ncbi:Kelch repeat-containing protein [Longirhabdus pacifica]|uniref:Kelch repeat-containing protein n=1 Tax=Longirhabdus pacifica TaxID=2305227 RepID=UPI0010088537|nr:kelch repeat-containing protein [Longirhabdus pacifica]
MKKLFSLLLMMTMVFTIVPVAAFSADSGGTWEMGTPMLEGKKGHGVAEVDGKIYVIGGDDVRSFLSTVEMYDPNTNAWTTKMSMPTERSDLGIAVVDEKIYAIGGNNFDNYRLSTVEMYDPATNSWLTKASMPTERTQFGTAVVDGKIYVVGGFDSDNDRISTVEMYDPTTDSWLTKANMPTTRGQLDLAVVDQKIYAIGGANDNSVLSTVEMYNPITDTWETKSSMSTIRAGLSTAVLNEKIYAIGGINDVNGVLSTVEMYDPITNTWQAKADMLTKRKFLASIILNGKIYAIGGATENILSTVEIYTPESNVATPLNLTATAGDAKVTLNWNEVTDADTYNVYRSLTSGGSYTSVATNVYGTSYVDSPLTNGTTYYYVVTAVNEDGESAYSNEASATPQANDNSNRAILTIILNSGLLKEYDVSMNEVNTFMAWYESKSSLFYKFEKDYNLGSDVSRTDYVVHDMIELFEVREYKVSE